MKIINVCESTNGILTFIESFIINEKFANLKYSHFWTEKEAVEKAESLFAQCIKDNYRFDDSQNKEEIIEEALQQGVFADEGGNYYEVAIVWSGININE